MLSNFCNVPTKRSQNGKVERGSWGYPVANESALAYGAQQPFANGNYRSLALWSAGAGTKTLNSNGGIYWKWVNSGGANRFGVPTTNETGVAGGASVYFVNREGWRTATYWSPNTGAPPYWAWVTSSGAGTLGFPHP